MRDFDYTEETPLPCQEPNPGTEGLHRGQFTFYSSYFQTIERLPKSRQLETYRAIIDFALNGTEPTLTGGPAVVFLALRPSLEVARTKAAARLSSIQRM